MKAREVHQYLMGLGRGWVDPQETVDTFKAGDPEAEVRGIAVAWMSYTWALQRAVELGCNLFITHEPTFYTHRDNDASVFALPGVREKKALIEKHGLTILRCHDVWDQYPGEGIPDAWADWLGFQEAIVRDGYFRVYDGGGRTALEIARQVARRLEPLGQQAVQLVGPAERPVERVCLGTGAITPFRVFLEKYQADLAICTDDGFTFWKDAALAIDLGVPVIVVNHAASEEPGMIRLAEHLRERFPSVAVRHIEQGWIGRTVN